VAGSSLRTSLFTRDVDEARLRPLWMCQSIPRRHASDGEASPRTSANLLASRTKSRQCPLTIIGYKEV